MQIESLYFNDGMRRIDMVLVYEDDLDFVKEQRRKNFLRNLLAEGLEIETQNPGTTKKVSSEAFFSYSHALSQYATQLQLEQTVVEHASCNKVCSNSFDKYPYQIKFLAKIFAFHSSIKMSGRTLSKSMHRGQLYRSMQR